MIKTPKIIDVILHKTTFYTQRFLVLDVMPVFMYEKVDINGKPWLLAENGIFKSAYYKESPSRGFIAFAGREFEIPMMDGTVTKATGQWWDGYPFNNIMPVGLGTIKTLEDCYVFSSGKIDKTVGENVFANYATPSNNYSKYDKKSKDYMQTYKSGRLPVNASIHK